MIDYLKRTWLLFLVILAGMLIFGDAAQLAVTVYRLSAVALVLLVSDLMLDCREKWGIFPTLDLDAGITQALSQPLSAAVVFFAAVVFVVSVLFISTANAGALENAQPYLPQLSGVIETHWPAMPMRYVAAGQVEQESGWREHATLKTSRELGRGLVQMTIAYNASGKERFNIYRDAARMKALRGWDWQHDPYNVRNQLTFLILQDRSNFGQVRPFFMNDTEAHKGALVCYNAGSGRWLQRRSHAKLMGIPPDRWDDGLDRAYGKSETAILYGRPLWQAVNEYPRVIFKRAAKYRGLV